MPQEHPRYIPSKAAQRSKFKGQSSKLKILSKNLKTPEYHQRAENCRYNHAGMAVMTPRRSYQLALLWLSLLALFRAIDLGLRAGIPGALHEDLPAIALGFAELAMHATILAALRSRKTWAWAMAVTWYPAWIALMSARLYIDYDPVLALLWTPLFALTAVAHTALMRSEIREAYGIFQQPWHSLEHWLPAVVKPGALVLAAAYAFDFPVALCLWTTAAIAGATAPVIYRDG